MFEDIYPDIPAEPMAVGSTWSIKKQTKQQQNDVTIDMTYKLASAKKNADGNVECVLDLTGKAGVKGPMGVTGGGDVTGKVSFIPAQGRALGGKVVSTITAGAQGQNATVKMTLSYKETAFTSK
jgi:hypothetical protein